MSVQAWAVAAFIAGTGLVLAVTALVLTHRSRTPYKRGGDR